MGIKNLKLKNTVYPRTYENINTIMYYEETSKNQADNLVKNTYAIADSETTGHFIEMDSPYNQKRKNANDGIKAVLPDGTTMNSSHTVMLDIQNLPEEVRR